MPTLIPTPHGTGVEGQRFSTQAGRLGGGDSGRGEVEGQPNEDLGFGVDAANGHTGAGEEGVGRQDTAQAGVSSPQSIWGRGGRNTFVGAKPDHYFPPSWVIFPFSFFQQSFARL